MRIQSLTNRQTQQLAECREEWINIGLCCDPCDFAESKAAAIKCYEVAQLKPPVCWFVFDSPLAAAIGAFILRGQVRGQVGDKVRGQVGDQVWDKVWDKVRGQVRDQVWDKVRGQVRDQVWDKVRGQVGDQVWDQVQDQVRGQVRDQVWDKVQDKVRDQVWDKVQDQVQDQIYGSHDAGWLSYFSFFRNYCGLKNETEQLTGLCDIAKNCGWWAPYVGVCIFQHRHSEIHRDINGRLHNESGMACRYRDGFGVWCISGIRVDEQIVMRPETQTVKQIDRETNGDIRTIRIDRYGWARYLRDSASKCVDFRDNEVEGTKEALYVTQKNETRLVATCATGRVFAMGVPSQIQTCQSAQEWLAGNKKFKIVGRT